MKRIAITILFLAPLTAHANKTYNSEPNVTHDCAKEPQATVNVSSGTYVFTGTCEKIVLNGASGTYTVEGAKQLTVNGASNTVTVEAADRIAVNGSSNTLTYKKALTGTKPPKVANNGTGNKISQVK